MLSFYVDDILHLPMKSLLLVLLLATLATAGNQSVIALPQRDGAAAPLAAEDADFLEAREAFRVGNAVRFEKAAARLKDSPLEPYVAYYRLRMQLNTADAATVKAFLARPDDTPVIDRLRGEWLKLLGKRHKWDEFTAEYPHLLSGDVELTCYALQARWLKQDESALQEAEKLWLSGSHLPTSCDPVFDAALAKGAISAQDVWQRIRLALEAGNVSLAKSLTRNLPASRAVSAADLGAAAANPQHYLSRLSLKNSSDGQRLAALFALQRLAKQSPQLAFARWEKVAQDFSTAEQHYFYSWLGYEAALRQDPRALAWYKAAADAPLSELQAAWRVRAALRALDWQSVYAGIAAMSPQQQREDAWRYWYARALVELGHPDDAKALFTTLSAGYNFYGQLAANELGMPIASGIESAGYQPTPEELEAMLARPATQRTIALYRMDLRTEAYKEWVWEVRNFDDKQLLAASEIARRHQMYDRAINTAELTMKLHDFRLRYLAPYRDSLRGYIQQNRLEEAWVYGLMRQESRFVSHAKSNVGAAGLMQVMPATAHWIARKLGMRDYRKNLIHEVDTNLTLGTYYMKTVLEWFDNSPVLASAAYNAGPSRARQWRSDIPLEGAIYIETIPFAETREYVKKVMSNTVYYAQQFGQPARPLKQRLGVVAARNAENQKPIPDEH